MTESDKELLEYAAKAASLPAEYLHGRNVFSVNGFPWDPLNDDADALRLALKVGMLIDIRYASSISSRSNCVTYWIDRTQSSRIDCGEGLEPGGALRRAIVQAAAEIGKSMK